MIMMIIIIDCFTINHKQAPVYSHLGYGSSLKEIAINLSQRSGLSLESIRFERLIKCPREGQSREGCPIAKMIIVRRSSAEQLCVLVRERLGHLCPGRFIIVALIVWEGVDSSWSSRLYDTVVHKLTNYGNPTERKCNLNKNRNCACQGLDSTRSGACYSFGCSYSMYTHGCKFGRSRDNEIRRFKLTNQSEESELEYQLNKMASHVGQICKSLIPEAFKSLTKSTKGDDLSSSSSSSSSCRIGLDPDKPFSSVTACLDFVAHNHRDIHNVPNDITVIVNLIRNPVDQYQWSSTRETQYHVLPCYLVDLKGRTKANGLQILTKFPVLKRLRSSPLLSRRKCQRLKKKALRRSFPEKRSIDNKGSSLSSSKSSPSSAGLRSTNKSVNSKSISIFSTQSKPVHRFPAENQLKDPNHKGYIYEFESDNEDSCLDPRMGGVGIALEHGSIMIECSKHEVHSTTPLRQPNRLQPNRLSLIFYQHKNLDKPNHGSVNCDQPTIINKPSGNL
ncbi:methylcytosine dioxygenase TET2-like [Panonychus citri]|uniref:methylcytosine dioxygenase TET2-like n=1 Tax=Panonychus citri TaxID=50023 RepID=UPI002307817F|nr:methylcytosine dioxygenase TET2-like [Panonychus citri]